MPEFERPCRICSKPFIANKYAGNRQAVCGDAGCKKTAKKLRQAHWCARNPDYFRGPENSCRKVGRVVDPANHRDWTSLMTTETFSFQ